MSHSKEGNSVSLEHKVLLTIPMYPDMELAAAKTASVLAELMDFRGRAG